MPNKTNPILKIIFSKKMLLMLFLGFSSGIPFLITKDILKAWMTDEKIDIAVIGLFSAISFPYTFKFIWSPVMDRYTPSFLGRRRGWMLITQVLTALSILIIGQFNPHHSLSLVAVAAIAIAFFGSSQDIVLDAFRRETLNDDELGLGTGIWVNAYRFANLATVGLAFMLADKIGYKNVHLLLAAMMGIGILTTLLAPEPKVNVAPPRTLKEAVIQPFQEFLKRKGAWFILAFILLYKIGDNMAAAMNIPFILSLGFQKTEYFVVVKGLGMGALFFGMFAGGIIMVRLGIARSLWIFGILQMISTAGFALLSITGKNYALLSGVVSFELLSAGLGTAAYSAYMASQTNKRFTATQYALLTSLMAVPGTLVAALTGFLVKYLGWPEFYFTCAIVAIPGLLMLQKIAPWNSSRKA